MQSAKRNDNQPQQPAGSARSQQVQPSNALVPARVASMPIEPPHPKEVRDKLEFTSAATYKKAVQLADRFYWQAQLAVDRRIASVKKAERQAQIDQTDTASSYERQVAAAHQRYRQVMETAQAKYRQTLFICRQNGRQAEDVYKEVLAGVAGYGDLQLRSLALADARSLTTTLIQAYKGSLGPDGLGNIYGFLAAVDRAIDHARDRQMIVPVQFAESLIKAIAQRQIRYIASQGSKDGLDPKAEAERIVRARMASSPMPLL